jgi:hypothetical protein
MNHKKPAESSNIPRTVCCDSSRDASERVKVKFAALAKDAAKAKNRARISCFDIAITLFARVSTNRSITTHEGSGYVLHGKAWTTKKGALAPSFAGHELGHS